MKLKIDRDLMNRVSSAYLNCSPIRANRKRLKDHTYGQQWSDLIRTNDGRILTEHEYAIESGMRPLTNNLLRSLVKAVLGRFRYNLLSAPADKACSPLSSFHEANQTGELDSRTLEEFLISGCAIQHLVCERRPGTELSVWADIISPDKFFVNSFTDPRGSDIRLIGHISDLSLDELKLRFGHGSTARCKAFERCYAGLDSLTSRGTCRVIEAWTFRSDPARPEADPHWHCRFLAPDGSVLDETRSPFPSGSHPYAVKLYPLTDGEVHSFIEDLVGQQKHINTLITLIDHILANSAKGVLLMPMDAVVPGSDLADICKVWSKPGAVIPVNPSARMMPTEVSASGASHDASVLLDTEMKLFQQISGVSSALQGQLSGSNVSASLFESQVQNSAIALLDIYESFNSFRAMRDRLALELVNTISH